MERFDRYLPMIESEMRNVTRGEDDRLNLFYGMMHYHLGWADEHFHPLDLHAGKRIRPTICMMACEAVGGNPEDALPAAAALELLHNFSLIHDDIEDDSRTRRHRSTVWALWGVPQAINTGDGMYSLAYKALLGLQRRSMPQDLILEAMERFSATCVALTEGQYLDMSFEERMEVTAEEYLHMVERKTAALLSTSAYLGALIGGADRETAALYSLFGKQLGIAFQMEDDILGIWGDEEVTGKPVASDILEKKKTLPVIFGLMKETSNGGSSPLWDMFRQDEITAEQARKAARILEEYGARSYTNTLAAEAHQMAMAALEGTGIENEAQADLRALAEKLLRRES